MKPAVTISGSFQKALNQIKNDIISFQELGCNVLSPRMFLNSRNEEGFVVLDSDGNRRPAAIHGRHLVSIKQSVLLWVRLVDGYVGLSTALEIGYAKAVGVPVFSSEPALDNGLNRFLTVVDTPEKAFKLVQRVNKSMPLLKPANTNLQASVAGMSSECGFEDEEDEEILGLLDSEILELKEAVIENRTDLNLRHNVSEELADCAIYLFHFANQAGIDLYQAIEEKIQLNVQRWSKRSGTG